MLTTNDIVSILILSAGLVTLISWFFNSRSSTRYSQQVQNDYTDQLERQRALIEREEALMARIEKLVDRLERN